MEEERLRTRVEAAILRSQAAVPSGEPPVAAFITYELLQRVQNVVNLHTQQQRHGWSMQAALARAVADMTGSPIPANDGSAEYAGQTMARGLHDYHKRLRNISRRNSRRRQLEQQEMEAIYTCPHGCTPPGGDGGGSIRIPAAFAGVYGIKATQGRVARAASPTRNAGHNIMNNATSGPLTRTVRDAAEH